MEKKRFQDFLLSFKFCSIPITNLINPINPPIDPNKVHKDSVTKETIKYVDTKLPTHLVNSHLENPSNITLGKRDGSTKTVTLINKNRKK